MARKFRKKTMLVRNYFVSGLDPAGMTAGSVVVRIVSKNAAAGAVMATPSRARMRGLSGGRIAPLGIKRNSSG